MSTEEITPDNPETSGDQTTDAPEEKNPNQLPSIQSSTNSAGGTSAAAVSQREDDDESRPAGEDFGALLDRFEQEQAAFQEGEVVRGTVVGISERGVVIDFGYKSEGIVHQAEFMDNGKLTVEPGDEFDVLVKSMETHAGYPVLSRDAAVRM